MEVIRLDGDPDACIAITDEELDQWIQNQREAVARESETELQR
jgi:hypothetical protein